MDGEPLYSVVSDADLDGVDLDEFGEPYLLSPTHALVVSGMTLSRLYHQVKWRLPDGSALFVAEVAGTPKMKGQAPGSVAWTREAAARA